MGNARELRNTVERLAKSSGPMGELSTDAVPYQTKWKLDCRRYAQWRSPSVSK